jgi:glycosyltransferase involved in cell wall biosynthesis
MDILAVTDNLGNTGGAEISAQTIIKGLSYHTEVDEITVVGVEPTDKSWLDFGNASVVSVTLPKRIHDLPALAKDLVIERLLAREIRSRSDSVDIIHAHHRQSTLALSHVDTSAQTITTIRDFWPTCPISTYNINGDRCTGCGDRLDDCVTHNELARFSEMGTKAYLLAKRRHQQPVISSLDCAVFIAQHIRERLSESIDFPAETQIIYNPVWIDEDINPTSPSSPTFVTASSLTRSKGIETAIRAVGHVVERYPSCQLIIFGDGPERDRLKEEFGEREWQEKGQKEGIGKEIMEGGLV